MTYTDHRSPVHHLQRVHERQLQTIHTSSMGPMVYNNLTVQSTSHATMVDTPDSSRFASFIARREVNGSSPLGRETFLTTVTWKDDWPNFDGGKPILLSESLAK